MNRHQRRAQKSADRKSIGTSVKQIADSLPNQPSEIPMCVYPSLEEVQRSAPDKNISTESDFQKYCANVEIQIQDLESKGMKVRKVLVLADEFFDWLNAQSDSIKKMSPPSQRATYAAYVAMKSEIAN